MNSELATLATEIDANVSHAHTITFNLSESQLNWRPDAERWSIGQCLAHLNQTNTTGLSDLEALVNEPRPTAQRFEGPFEYGYLAKKIVKSVDLPIERKLKSPRVFQPADTVPLETIQAYEQVCRRLRSVVLAADGLDLRKVKCELPALPLVLRKLVRLSLGARLALLVTHDRRHLWQAEQVRISPKFPNDSV